MSTREGYVDLSVVKIHRMTDKAMHVELEDGELIWLPLSQCLEQERYAAGDENITVLITTWLAQQKGLEGS